jgi:hypothetical protein
MIWPSTKQGHVSQIITFLNRKNVEFLGFMQKKGVLGMKSAEN